jgi:nucleoside-diphosphate-sugar epimerase
LRRKTASPQKQVSKRESQQVSQRESPPKPGRVAALTGATGFIGQELLRQLLAAGWQVRALTRRTPSGPATPHLTWIKGDLAQKAQLAELVAGADVVIHLAGAIKARRRSDFHAANAAGVAAMIEASIIGASSVKKKSPHFILISSLAAREPALSDYAASKAAGEETLRRSAPGLNWTIIRPPAVYGPGDMEILKIFQSLKYGVGFLVGGAQNRLSLIHVGDLCAGILATMAKEPAFGRLLHIDDGRKGGYTVAEIMTMGSRILKKKPRHVRLPRLLLVMAAGLNQGMCRLTGRAPMLTFGKVRELHHSDWVCDGENVADLFDWQPEKDAETGLAETLSWYRDQGLI